MILFFFYVIGLKTSLYHYELIDKETMHDFTTDSKEKQTINGGNLPAD